jgi:hypothetical protein
MLYFTFTTDGNVTQIMDSSDDLMSNNTRLGEEFASVESVLNFNEYRGSLGSSLAVMSLKYDKAQNSFYSVPLPEPPPPQQPLNL